MALGALDPNFRFAARGGAGAPGQIGGNGGDGADGPTPVDTTVIYKLGLTTCEANSYAAISKVNAGNRRTSVPVSIYKGQNANPGTNGGNGGVSSVEKMSLDLPLFEGIKSRSYPSLETYCHTCAGANGRNGDGGNGGSISLQTLAKDDVFAKFYACAFDASFGWPGSRGKVSSGGKKGESAMADALGISFSCGGGWGRGCSLVSLRDDNLAASCC
jgi:hypothetical protein